MTSNRFCSRRLIWVPAVLLCVWAVPARTAEAPPAADDIGKLLQGLKSDDEDERARVRKQLSEKGEAIRAQLEKALDASKNEPDFASQIKLVFKSLSQNEVLKPFDAPKTISMDVKDTPVKEVLAKFKEAFGHTVECADAAQEKKVSLVFKDRALFDALEDLRKAAGLIYQFDQQRMWQEKKAEGLPFKLVEAGEKSFCAVGVSGPFLVFVSNVSYSENRSLMPGGESQTHKSLSLQIFIVPAPEAAAADVSPVSSVFIDKDGKEQNGQYSNNRMGRLGGYGDVYGSGRMLHDSIQLSGDFAGPLAWKTKLLVRIPLKLSSKKIENLSAQDSQEVQVPDGIITVGKPMKEEKNNRWIVPVTVPNTAEASLFAGGGMKTMIRAGRGAKAEGPPAEKDGVFFLDDKGAVISNQGYSGRGSGNSMTYDLNLQSEPSSVLIQWHSEKTERSYELKIEKIPVP